jgi:hypothetical protein
MAALVQSDFSRLAPSQPISSRPAPKSLTISADSRIREPRAFPEAATARTLPLVIRDETLEVYAFVFCQGGFHQLGMTFEQFLLVAAALKSPELTDARDYEWTL